MNQSITYSPEVNALIQEVNGLRAELSDLRTVCDMHGIRVRKCDKCGRIFRDDIPLWPFPPEAQALRRKYLHTAESYESIQASVNGQYQRYCTHCLSWLYYGAEYANAEEEDAAYWALAIWFAYYGYVVGPDRRGNYSKQYSPTEHAEFQEMRADPAIVRRIQRIDVPKEVI